MSDDGAGGVPTSDEVDGPACVEQAEFGGNSGGGRRVVESVDDDAVYVGDVDPRVLDGRSTGLDC